MKISLAFFYGRNPQRFQQDTVIQHSRMYGARPKVDLSVTRFYTSRRIYTAMKKMHEFDSTLREAFEKGTNNNEVIFIQEENNTIIPCSPNKILLSNITTIKPGKRLLPVGFQTLHKKELSKIIDSIDSLIDSRLDKSNLDKPILIDIGLAEDIIKRIADSLIFEDGYEWDLKAFISSMQFLSNKSPNTSLNGKIYVIVRKNRKINRKDHSEPPKFEDAPDTPKGEKGELRVAREIAKDIPCLILLRQIGSTDEGWNGGPFWWPVLVAPQNITPVIFSSEVEK